MHPGHKKLRAELLPEAIGRPCPLQLPGCLGVMTAANAQMDHIVERSRGGLTTRQNCRIVCRVCNHKRGAQLGGRVAHRKARARGSAPAEQRPPQPPQLPPEQLGLWWL